MGARSLEEPKQRMHQDRGVVLQEPGPQKRVSCSRAGGQDPLLRWRRAFHLLWQESAEAGDKVQDRPHFAFHIQDIIWSMVKV